jgi:Neuraminidase (sialidase)
MPGDIVQLKDGRYMLCYTASPSDPGPQGIMACISTDKGKTWGEPYVLQANPKASERGYYIHPSLFYAKNGDLLLSYIYCVDPAVNNCPEYGQNYYRRSFDEGKTWSDQFVMTPWPGFMIMHNAKVRVLSSGRIVAPVERLSVPVSATGNDHRGYVATVYYSDDDGYTWLKSDNEVDMYPLEAQESHVVELKDGRLMLVFRTYSGYAGRAYSSDKGATWSKGELIKELKMSSNASPITVDRIPSTGDLLLTRCTGGEEGRRTPFVSVISKDDGVTWENEKVIGGDPKDDYGYQSVMFDGDKCIMSYHKKDGLHVAVIDVNWFYQK